jgi:hypothetical protein
MMRSVGKVEFREEKHEGHENYKHLYYASCISCFSCLELLRHGEGFEASFGFVDRFLVFAEGG